MIILKRSIYNDGKNWADNKIGDEGARLMSESLKTNATLTTLNLSGDKNEVKWNNKSNNYERINYKRMKKEW